MTIGGDEKTITFRQVVGKDETSQSFHADAVLVKASQDKTFQHVGRAVTDAVLDGQSGTILCYGQTGAGKSFTMVGSTSDFAQRGLAPRCLAHCFLEAANRPEFEYSFRFSCLEIYNDTLADLLPREALRDARRGA